MGEYNYSNDAATEFLNALLADLEMAKTGSESSALMGKSERNGEPGELCDEVEGDIHLKISESIDTSTASSDATYLLPGVAVAKGYLSAMGDPAVQPLLNSNSGACTGLQERSTIPSYSVTLFSTRFPDKNNNHSSPLTIFITNPTSGLSNNDCLHASSIAPGPVNAPSTVGPAHRPTKRFAKDIARHLVDRITEYPKGDIDAWLGAIEEQRKHTKLDDVRTVYEGFFVVSPAAADQWISYLQHVERIFQMSLFNVPNVVLRSMYLDYIRRQYNLTRDTGGKASAVVNQCYELLLNNVGFDREAGGIWTEYIEFGQNQQKVDTLRKVYQWAVTMPVQGVELLWKEYILLEQGLNKLTARKHLQEYSPMFITTRYCLNEQSKITKGLRLDTLSRLAPSPGYAGFQDYTNKVELRIRWIQWEKGEPLVAKEDPAGLRTRIIHVFNEALMALRFWPEMWFDAAEWCFANGIDNQGGEFLNQGTVANPGSCILYFKYAERLEATTIIEGGEEALIRKGELVRKPHDQLRNRLYELVRKIELNEKEDPALIADAFELTNPLYERANRMTASWAAKDAKVATLRNSTKAQLQVMTETISTVWINLIRAIGRVQGHGKVIEPLGGSRQIFAGARKSGNINRDVYLASSLIEYHCNKYPAALKIFGRGMRIFPEDENFVLEYLRFLVAINDITKTRAVFEAFLARVTAEKARQVYAFFFEYEAHYGELCKVYKLEKRKSEIYPTYPVRSLSPSRYAYNAVDPCSSICVVSTAQQCKPKSQAISPPDLDHITIDGRDYLYNLVSPTNGTANGSTVTQKRPPNEDLAESSEYQNLKKRHQPDSPLIGAAGQRRHQPREPFTLQQHQPQPIKFHKLPAPTELHTIIRALLSILPGQAKYQAASLRPEAIVELLCNLNLPDHPSSINRSVPQAPGRQY
ncbi:hypothetical protein HOY82DRAFT_641051 [Tuber indicum]|nr:hypothetical protein HOY82DRAFT_641051 [Tuber indicum]